MAFLLEVAPMDFRPVSEAAIPFTLKIGLFRIHLREWNYIDLRSLNDSQRLALGAQDNAVVTHDRACFPAFIEDPFEGSGGCLDAALYELAQSVGQLRRVAKCPSLVLRLLAFLRRREGL